MADVVLKNVLKNYRVGVLKDTLRNINMEIADGEFIVFVGPSGCGKSTLLRMIAGLEDITSGELLIGGQYMNDVPPVDRNIGMVFQSYALYPHMDVFQNMAFGLRLKKMDKESIRKRVNKAAEMLGLMQYLQRKPKALSGGQRQRVAIGRCIVQQPSVFLFDEPLSNLDAALRVKMRIEIAKLHQELNATIIYVTHDQVEAMTLADKICVLSPLQDSAETNLEQFGSPLELYHNPQNKFVAGFIGSPQMNFINAVVGRSGPTYTLSFDGITLAIPDSKATQLASYVGKEVVFGIRPEHVYDDYDSINKYANAMEAKVEVTELMGAEIYLYLTVGSASVTARVAPTSKAKPGDTIKIAFDLSKLHIFDKENRTLYDLERIWRDGKTLELSELK